MKSDVVIIGSNLGGSLLANILAKNNLSVVMVDPCPHPKFTIGEATTPDTSCYFKIVGEKYGVPEISNLSNFHDLSSKVSRNCGVKRSFSFLYHREGHNHSPSESHQFPGPDNKVLGPDCHFFRQDTDAYMFHSALKYGATAIKGSVEDVIFDEDYAQVICKEASKAGWTRINCSYVFDASGRNSVLVKKFNLREEDALETDSRGIFTHMVGVKAYDGIGTWWPFNFKNLYGLKSPLPESTLHHVFKGGWMWIIPFDNNDSSLNPICSVGLMLDRKVYPSSSMSPEEEFNCFINKFPSVKYHLEFAKPVRDWVRLDKLQYSSKSIVGDRFCLSANSAGFVDPLYSSGIGLTISVVDLLAERLLESFRSNNFDTQKFKAIETTFKESLEHYDEVVSCSYLSFRSYELWDAWFRVWVTGNFLGTVSSTQLFFNYLGSGNKKYLHKTSNGPLGIRLKEQNRFFSECYTAMGNFERGGILKEDAIDKILEMIRGHELIPNYFDWGNTRVRCTPSFGFWGTVRLYLWSKLKAKNGVSQRLFSYNPWKSFVAPYLKKII